MLRDPSETYPSDAPPNDELCGSTAVGRNASELDDDANDHDARPQKDTLPAAERIAEGKAEASAQETAYCVDGDDETLVGAVVQDFWKVVGESWSRNDTRHDSLIIPKKEEVGSGNRSDQHLECMARRAPVGRVAGFADGDGHGEQEREEMEEWGVRKGVVGKDMGD